jgi:hypothetical protein
MSADSQNMFLLVKTVASRSYSCWTAEHQSRKLWMAKVFVYVYEEATTTLTSISRPVYASGLTHNYPYFHLQACVC